MNDERSFERTARAWLELGANQAPDRAVQTVLLAIETTPQERDLRIPWRFPTMNTPLRVGMAAVIGLLLLGAGFYIFGGTGSDVGGAPATAPPTATPEASSATPSPTPEGLLPEGPHVLLNEGRVQTTVTIAAPDWYGPGSGLLAKGDAGMIVFAGADLYVYGDPCKWATTRPDSPSSSVDEFVAAMSAQASRNATEPVDVTVDGYSGKSITVHVPDDADFGLCDQATFGSWGLAGPDPAPFRYHQGPGQIDKLWVLDVDGELVVIDGAYYEGTPQTVIDELEAIAESATFK